MHENLKKNQETQTDLDLMTLTDLFSKLSIYESQIPKLRSRLSKMDLSNESFRLDDEKVKYFTGLESFELLSLIHDYVSPLLFTRSNAALTTFQQLLLTLMKLRLNLPFKYLAYR